MPHAMGRRDAVHSESTVSEANRNKCNESGAAQAYAGTMTTNFRCAALLTLTAALSQPPAVSEPSLAGPCSSGKFREFDFWAGEWDVHDAAGKPAGRNTVTIEEQGCVVVERWRSAGGGTGQSFNYYDPAAGRWKQRWVGLGLVLEMEGGRRGEAMVMEGPLQYLAGNRNTLLRGTWTKLPDGRLHHEFVESDDGGKTWKPWFDGYYTRVRGPG
jgi:hypothetical protein